MSDKPTNRFRFFLLSFFFSGLGTNWWDDDFLFVAFFSWQQMMFGNLTLRCKGKYVVCYWDKERKKENG